MPSTLKRRHGFPHKRRWASTFVGGEILPVTFPGSPLTTRVHIALGADLTASHLTWNWADITDHARHDLGITVTAGRRDERTWVTASRCQLKLENDGRFTRRNPLGPYFGLLTPNTPIWIELDPGSGFVDRYYGFVNEWPTRWTDESGTDCTVTIQCSGVLRRLTQGRALKSPVNRTFSGVAPNDYVPHAYWPMEDGSSSTQFASALSGHPAMSVAGTIDFAANSALTGSDPLPTFTQGATATVGVPSYAATSQWVVMFTMLIPTEPASKTTFVEFTVPGGSETLWRLVYNPTFTTMDVETYDNAGTLVNTAQVTELTGGADWTPSVEDFFGTWATYFIASVDRGGGLLDHNSGLSIGPNMVVTGNLGTSHTHGSITGIKAYGGNGASFGHFAVYIDPNFGFFASDPDASNNSAAVFGWAGELAHERIRRLCREEGITLYCQAATSVALGPQPSGTLLEVLRDAERADQGVLYEYQFGLGYQSSSQRYNQPVGFHLDFDSGHVAGTPEPADDDQRLTNRFTANRPGGSSATRELETGTLGTGPGGPGVYAGSDTVNVYLDAQLADHAGWKVHLGTVDEDRWPLIGFHLHGSPELIPGWLSVPFGARVNITNPPAEMNPAVVDGFIEGYTERWDTVSWTAGLFVSPASPYTVGVLDSTGTRLDSGTSTLAAAVTAGASSLSVATSSTGDLWSTSAGDYPQEVTIAGIHVTVTAVSGASSPQTFTVTGATVTKDLASGEQVHERYPIVLAL